MFGRQAAGGGSSLFGGTSNVLGGKSTTQQDSEEFNNFVKQVSGEMTLWERSGQWLPSSFSPLPAHPPVVGFSDTSPEEFRVEAYQAIKDNTYAAYQARWAEVQQLFKQLRDPLKMSTTEGVQALRDVFYNKSPLKQPAGWFGKPAATVFVMGAANTSTSRRDGAHFLRAKRVGFGGTTSPIFGRGAEATTNPDLFGGVASGASKSLFGTQTFEFGGFHGAVFGSPASEGTLKYIGGTQPTLPAPDTSPGPRASVIDDLTTVHSGSALQCTSLADANTAGPSSAAGGEHLPASASIDLAFHSLSLSASADVAGPSCAAGEEHLPAPASTDPAVPSLSVSTSADVAAPPVDPAEWSFLLSDSERTDLVRRGPLPLSETFTFPKTHDGQSFHYHYTYRQLINGEKVKRSWLTYSERTDAVYCFCCKLFSSKITKLVTRGQRDWVNIGALLKEHEKSPDHCNNMVIWKDFALRLSEGKTIDAAEMALLEVEKNRWRDVLTRLISIIQSLAERNLALRGSVDALHQDNNGNFLKEVELIAEFDPVLRDHVRRVNSGAEHVTYLGKTIQNELINCISDRMLEKMVAEIKASKYYAVILDCTPDVSHQEQMSVVVRTVSLGRAPEIKEHFLGFLIAPESTGLGLSTLILNRLKELNIPFQDCRGQAYDSGANMRGKNRGVQARLLEKNPRAFYVPCGAHTLNLMVSNAAKVSVDATCFFGYVEKLYTLFSGCPQRWAILEEHVDILLKSWSETHWESQVSSIEPLRCQANKVREALLEVRDKADDSKVKVEAHSLAEEIGSFRFQICCVVWYDILSKINTTSKLLQSANMQLDDAVNLLQKNKEDLISYRTTGFKDAQVLANDICEQLNTEAVLKEKLETKKRHFAYEAPDEPQSDAMRRMELSFFNAVVDCTVQSLEDRHQSLGEVRDNFGVLLNFSQLDAQTRLDQCKLLGDKLTCEEEADIDGSALAAEIGSLPVLPQANMTTFELLTYLSKNEVCELYPNLWVALRIACTLPVTVASAERSFSKLKLIKNYLRSPMAQEKLSGLGIISINNKVGHQVTYSEVIADFASRKARKHRFRQETLS